MSRFQKYYASTSRYYWVQCDVTPDTKYPSPLKNFINIFLPCVHEEIETIFSRDLWRDSQKPKDTFSVKLCSLEGSTFTSGLNFKFILSNGPIFGSTIYCLNYGPKFIEKLTNCRLCRLLAKFIWNLLFSWIQYFNLEVRNGKGNPIKGVLSSLDSILPHYWYVLRTVALHGLR